MAAAAPLRIAVKVQPRSSHDRVVGSHGGALTVQVKAPPVEGAANAALVEVVAKWLGVPRRAVSVARGHTGRDKLLEVAVDDPVERGRIQRLVAGSVDSAEGAA